MDNLAGFVNLLSILFIGLKLTDNLDWSWFWVLSPLWIFYGTIVLLAIVIAAFEVSRDKSKSDISKALDQYIKANKRNN